MCSCGPCNYDGVKKIEVYFQVNYIMTFLMGLNDSFSQAHTHILLLDPLPPINRVFSLVIQVKRHGQLVFNPLALFLQEAWFLLLKIISHMYTTRSKRHPSHIAGNLFVPSAISMDTLWKLVKKSMDIFRILNTERTPPPSQIWLLQIKS